MDNSLSSQHCLDVVISGAGISGLMSAILLARQNHRVRIYEQRSSDLSEVTSKGRSVNFTLSERGRSVLENAGILENVLKHALPLKRRVLHFSNGMTVSQRYGNQKHEVLHAIRRVDLHQELISAAKKESLIQIFWESELTEIDLSSNGSQGFAFFKNKNTPTEKIPFDLFIGADGVHSVSRERLTKIENIPFHKNISDWSYKEFVIPNHSFKKKLALDSLHLWSRGNSLVCVIPNPDGSWVGNLLIQSQTIKGMQSLQEMQGFIQRHYQELLLFVPDLADVLFRSSNNSIYTTAVSQWHFKGKAVLIGDACHAVSPFLGQGMNSALGDALILSQCLQEYPDIQTGISYFQSIRKPDTDALLKLSAQHTALLSENIDSIWQIVKTQVDLLKNYFFPKRYTPVYSLIAHTTTPYRRALQMEKSARYKIPLSNQIIGKMFRIYAKAQGIEFKIAESQEEKNQAYALRRTFFSTEGLVGQDDIPDQYDSHSAILLALHRGQAIGTMRLIDVSRSCKTLDLNNAIFPPEVQLTEVVEYGGLGVHPDFRGKGSVAMAGLIELAYRYAFAHRIRWGLVGSKRKQYDKFRAFNQDCFILKENDPTPKQLENRKKFGDFFEKHAQDIVVYIFDLSNVDYLGSWLRILRKQFLNFVKFG